MRFFISGPRMFGGLIRPGVSFSAQPRSQPQWPPRAVARDGAYVYVMENAHGHQKVGYSEQPEKRRRSLQTGSSGAIVIKHSAFAGYDAPAIEANAKSILAPHRLSGEWFNVSTEIAIAAIYGAAAQIGARLGDSDDADMQMAEDEYVAAVKRHQRRHIFWVVVLIIALCWGLGWLVQH